MRPHRRQPTRLPCPWDSPGKNTGVGCHFLLQCMKVKRESEVAQLSPTLSDPMDCSPPVSSIHEILQARVLAWASISTRPHSKESTSKAGDAGDYPWVGKIAWRKKWPRTPVFLSGKFCGQRRLVGCSPWDLRVGHK